MENVCMYICAYMFREVNEEYSKEVSRVTDKVLELLSEGLGLEGKVLRSTLGGDEMQLEMKINMYPPCPQPELALGVEPHTDMCALTILVPNDVPGLQVWKDGAWVAVDYIQDALFVHVGDQIEVRTCTLPTYILFSISFSLFFTYQYNVNLDVVAGVEQWQVQECSSQELGKQGTRTHVVGHVHWASS